MAAFKAAASCLVPGGAVVLDGWAAASPIDSAADCGGSSGEGPTAVPGLGSAGAVGVIPGWESFSGWTGTVPVGAGCGPCGGAGCDVAGGAGWGPFATACAGAARQLPATRATASATPACVHDNLRGPSREDLVIFIPALCRGSAAHGVACGQAPGRAPAHGTKGQLLTALP